jgi:rare lipoprotein A
MWRIFLLVILFLITSCGPSHYVVRDQRMPPSEKKEVMEEEKSFQEAKLEKQIEKRETKEVQYGIASWYGEEFHGRSTSSGEVYDMHQLTCAHNTLPLGTIVMVTNLGNGRSLELKVNDRGPFVKERILDVSYAASKILGIWEKGTALVKVEVLVLGVEPIQRFTLQVGSFADENNAQKLFEKLRKNFENVYVTTIETPTQKYHRVRIGQFETKDSALIIAEKLSQMGFKVLVTSR